MKTLLPLLALCGLMLSVAGCSHTTKKYYEDDRRVDHHEYDHDHHDRDWHH